MASFCFNCSTELSLPSGQVSRGASCDKCQADARCCKNCQQYDTSAYNECHEPQAERIVEKERSNMCDYFQLSQDRKGSSKNLDKKKSALSSLDDLFKK